MADLTVTASKVAPLNPLASEFITFIAASTITAGQPCYQTSAGKAAPADANAAGLQQVRGIAVNAAAAGQPVDLIIKGLLGGFTISQAYDTQLFLSDTVGAIADAAGTKSVPVGRVVGLTDKAVTKAIFVDVSMATQW